MKVLNIDEVVDVFNKKITEPQDLKVKGIDHIEDNVIVYLNIKDCYDNGLSDGIVNLAIEDKPFYKEGFVLEKLYEYNIYSYR